MNCRANLYAGLLCSSLLAGLGVQVYVVLINPLIDGAVGFKFKYFHLDSEGMSVFPLFMTFLT